MTLAKRNKFFRRKALYIIIFLLVMIIVPITIFSTTHGNSSTLFSGPTPTSFHPEVRYAQTPNATIAYYTRGTGEPLILLPGFGMTMQDWDPLLLEKLAAKNKLIILDFRGVGASTGDLNELTEKQIAADVIATMDNLKIKKAHILGWSLGSFVGQLIAENYPERVDKLILISTAPGDQQQIHTSSTIGDTIQNNLGGTWEDVYTPLLFYSDKAKDDYLSRLQQSQKLGESPTIERKTIEAKLAYERAFAYPEDEAARTALLSKINAPTLLITGEQDMLLVPENAKRVAKRIPNAKLILVPQAGHGVLFEKAAEVSKEIHTFLEEK